MMEKNEQQDRKKCKKFKNENAIIKKMKLMVRIKKS